MSHAVEVGRVDIRDPYTGDEAMSGLNSERWKRSKNLVAKFA